MVSRLIPVDSANPKLPAVVVTATTATDAETIAGTATDKWVTPAKAAVVAEKYDVRRAGVVLDDLTDNATTLANAINTVNTAGGGEVLFPPGVARTSVALDLVGKNGVKLQGVDLFASVIKQTTASTPVVRVGSAYQALRDLQLRYASASSTSGATALQIEGILSFSEFRNLYLWNCHTGISYGGAQSPTGEFSNTWDNIRIGPFSAQGIRLVPTATGGTGSNWGNVYVSNFNGSTAGACTDYPVQMTNHGGVINQLNIEWCSTVTAVRDLVLFQQCHGIVVNRLHMEGNVLPASRGFISTFTTGQCTVAINALHLHDNDAASGSIGIVRPGAGTHINLSNVIVDNNAGILASFYAIFDTSAATGANVIIDGLLDTDGHLDGIQSGYVGSVQHRGYGGSMTGWINAQAGTTYTFTRLDGSRPVTLSNAAAITATVPPNSSVPYPIGAEIDIAQIAAGQVTVAPGVGVTINGTPGLKLRAQYSRAKLLKTATDTWLLSGDIAA